MNLEVPVRLAYGFAAAATLLLAGQSLAAEQPATNPNSGDELICRKVPPQAGTRLGGTRECHTRREWEQRRHDDRQMTEDSQRRDSRGVAQ
jgi:hypothetical protein